MKRKQFRLASVLRYYELRKQQTEFELQRASRILYETDLEIIRLGDEITALAALIQNGTAATFTTDVWIACYRKSDQAGTSLAAAARRRIDEAAIVAQLEATRNKWSVAEESLRNLKHEAVSFNHAEADKSQQAMLDETVLRKWMISDSETIFDT